jgi:hypothetical protein
MVSLEKTGRFIRPSFHLQDCQYLLPPVMLSIGTILICFYLASTLLQNLPVLQLLKLVLHYLASAPDSTILQ